MSSLNLHISQTEEARAEQHELMSVTKQIISAQDNKPIISLVQDSLIAAYLLTLRDTFLTRDMFMQLTMSVRYPVYDKLPPPAILKPVPLWTGKQLFSLLLPPIQMDKTVRNGMVDGVDKNSDGYLDVEEQRVLILEGEIMTGTMCKKTLGNTAGGVVHILVNDLGHQVAANFIGDAQRLLVDYMEYRGFSVGISDCVTSKNVLQKVNSLVDRCFQRSDRISKEAVNASKRIVEGSITNMMSGMIAKGSSTVQEDIDWRNNINLMVTSGSKGSPINIAQIMAYVGQQSVEGSRIKLGSDGRTLPSFAHMDNTPAARGFVRNSYWTGLTAQEYFFHAMGGREGLVDTAVKTAVTGYIQRRLIKALEGVMVRYGNTVRNPQGQLFQTLYGGDGVDAVYIEKQKTPTFCLTNTQLRERYAVNPAQVPWVNPVALVEMMRAELDVLQQDRDAMRRAKLQVGVPDGTVFVPINAPRLLWNAKFKFKKKEGPLATLDQLVGARSAVLDRILHARGPEATFYVLIYLRSHIATRALLDAVGLRWDALCWIFSQVERLYFRSLVEPGEMVGTLGASSIGEPATQMTLNTFHLAGVNNSNMTLGVPRLKEIIDASAKAKTPCMRVYLEPPFNCSERMATSHGVALTVVKLSHVVASSDIRHDPGLWDTVVDEDRHIMDMHAALYKPEAVGGDDDGGDDDGGDDRVFSEWVIRLVLNREVLITKELTVVDVAIALERYLGDDARIIRSEVNMVSWVVRVRLCGLNTTLSAVETQDVGELKQLEFTAVKTVHDFLMDNTPVHGIPHITRTITHQEKVVCFTEDGSMTENMEWITDTEGTNLERLLTIDGVDKVRTICNHIPEVARVLGIEAALNVMIDDLRRVLSFDGGYVDDHHIQLLADLMTQSGSLTAVTRHGLRELGGSTLQRASFEESQMVLLDAGAFGASDALNGITGTVMLGQRIPAGTGICEVLVRKDALPRKKVAVVVPPLMVTTTTKQQPGVVVKPLTLIRRTASVPTAPVFIGRRRAGAFPAPALPPGMEPQMLVRPLQMPATEAQQDKYCPSSPVMQMSVAQSKYTPSSPIMLPS